MRAIGVAGQMHGVVACAAGGTALRRAMLWSDTRAVGLLGRYPADAERRVNNRLTPGMAGPLLLWLAQEEPEVLARARWYLQPKDWLRLRLTGTVYGEPSDAGATLLADADGQWDIDLIETLGLDPTRFAPIVDSWADAGVLTQASSRELGLRQGIPVVAGAGDTPAAALGSGLLSDGASQLSIGTGAQIVVMRAARPVFSPCLNGYPSAAPAGHPRWYVMAAMQNAGVALEWSRGLLGLNWDEAYRGAFADGSLASTALFVPYLTGERTPWMNPTAHGAWVGMSAHDDQASLMRAAFFGVAFAIRAGLEALRDHGATIRRLRLAGGGSIDPAWREVLTDVLGVPLDAVNCPNASARGAALLAGILAGFWRADELPALAPDATALSDPRTGVYDEDYRRFLRVCGALGVGPIG